LSLYKKKSQENHLTVGRGVVAISPVDFQQLSGWEWPNFLPLRLKTLKPVSPASQERDLRSLIF